MISDKPVDKLIAAISNVSEIAEVLAEPIDLSKMPCSEEGKSAAPEQKKKSRRQYRQRQPQLRQRTKRPVWQSRQAANLL